MKECELLEFQYEGSKVEAFGYEGKVWFMARGLGNALGMGNIRSIIQRVVPAGEVMRTSAAVSGTRMGKHLLTLLSAQRTRLRLLSAQRTRLRLLSLQGTRLRVRPIR